MHSSPMLSVFHNKACRPVSPMIPSADEVDASEEDALRYVPPKEPRAGEAAQTGRHHVGYVTSA
jgi:hypothetical protein